MDENKRYNVKEFAGLCGVTPRTLKYYEEMGIFAPASVSNNGYRLYDIRQLDEISAIRLFREHGLSLKEIREMLSGDDLESVLKRLKKQQEILDGKLEELKRQQYYVAHTLQLVQTAAEHMDIPFVEECTPRRVHSEPHHTGMVNYLLQGYGNGAILDGKTFALKGTYQVDSKGEILLSGKCLTLYCMGIPSQSDEKLYGLMKQAREQGFETETVYCEEILERTGGGQGLFRYFCMERRTGSDNSGKQEGLGQ